VAVPVASDISNQSVAKPLRDVVTVGVADLRPDAGAVHHLAEQQPCDALADLRLEMGVVAVKIKYYLRPNDFGDAACVAVFLFLKVDVALLEVALAVENDKLDFLPETAVKSSFQAWNLVFGVGLRITRQVVATLVEIHVEVVVRVVRPMEVAVLHAVFPERHVHPVVELRMGYRCHDKQHSKKQPSYIPVRFRLHFPFSKIKRKNKEIWSNRFHFWKNVYFCTTINHLTMTTTTKSATIPSKPLIEPKADVEKYISSKDFFTLLRREVDKYYESL